MALSYPSMTEGEWNKVVTNRKTFSIAMLKSNYKYFITSVATGAGAPLAAVKEYSPRMFDDRSNKFGFSEDTAIDFYVWAEDATDSGATITNTIEVSA